MNNNVIQTILDDDSLLEQFTELLIEEINNDDEAMDKKGRQLLSLCLSDENADDFSSRSADGVLIVFYRNSRCNSSL